MIPKILLGFLLLIILLLLCPVRLRIALHGEGEISIRAQALCFALFRYPKKKKPFRQKDYSPRALARRQRKLERTQAKQQKKLQKKQSRAAAKKRKPTATGSGASKKKSTLPEKLKLIGSLLREIPGPLFRYARIDLVALDVRIATGDAATTALAYGAACPAASYLLEGLHEFSNLHIHHPDRICVAPDFEAQKTSATLDLRLRLLLWQLLAVGLKTIVRLNAPTAGHTKRTKRPTPHTTTTPKKRDNNP